MITEYAGGSDCSSRPLRTAHRPCESPPERARPRVAARTGSGPRVRVTARRGRADGGSDHHFAVERSPCRRRPPPDYWNQPASLPFQVVLAVIAGLLDLIPQVGGDDRRVDPGPRRAHGHLADTQPQRIRQVGTRFQRGHRAVFSSPLLHPLSRPYLGLEEEGEAVERECQSRPPCC